MLLMAAILFLLAASVSAQEFGWNKVVYRNIEFSVLKTKHFQIYHYPKNADPVQDAARLLEKWYARHADLFGIDLSGPQKVILYDSFVDFQQANAVPGLISQAEGGVTESLGNRIVIPLTGIEADDDHVLGHELVHAFQFRVMRENRGNASSNASLPTWLIEGMAEYLSIGQYDPLTDMWMRDAVLHGDVPSVDDMARKPDKYFPYRFGEALWAFIGRRWGDAGVSSFFSDAAADGVGSAVKTALGLKRVSDLSAQWKQDLTESTAPQMAGTTPPKEVGRTLPGFGAGTNLGPTISPDGRYLAVFSQKDPFSMSLTLADARTGRILKSLGTSGADAHFDALHFIDASGGWSSDSRSFAFPVTREGSDAIAIADIPSGRIEKVIPLARIADVSGVAWSPDESRIAISATSDAVSGIWLLDPGTGSLQALTHGRSAAIQPSWSPDGSTLVFATDQGGKTDRSGLAFGSMNIGVIDAATGSVRILSVRDGATHIDPQFSPDGRSIYFVADPDGIPDVYRFSLDTGRFYRITRVATGISGLTRLSPCLSVSSLTGELVFSVFNNRNYEVHVLEGEEARGDAVDFPGAITLPSVALDAGSPSPSVPVGTVTPYTPSFQLLSASAASLGVSLGPLGTAIGGSTEAAFQDVLGNHLIDVIAQINGGVDTLGGQLVYENSSRRIAWDIGVAHTPQASYYLLPSSALPAAEADTGIVEQQVYTDQVALQGLYPFSANRRLEAQIGYSHIWYEQTAPVYYFLSGALVGEGQANMAEVNAPLDIVQAGLAYVGDYSYSGFTEPMKGYRYRFEVDGNAGSLTYLSTMDDVRGYLFLKPFAFALRGLHMGRYLGDSDSPLLADYFLGEPDLVRGYEYYSLLANEGAAGGDVPQIDRLFGSRIAVFNAELRLALLGNSELGLLNFPYVPLTLVGFFDAGVAWTGNAPPVLAASTDPGARVPVASAGAAIRFNLLGAAIVELYWAWPFQRPGVGGSWGFLIEEGW
jgi:Tol biopolymer transport system component